MWSKIGEFIGSVLGIIFGGGYCLIQLIIGLGAFALGCLVVYWVLAFIYYLFI